MKIAMIGQKGMPAKEGGVERHVHELTLRLVKYGHEVIVYCRKWYTESQSNQFQGVHLVHVPTLHTKHLDTITHTLLSTIQAMRARVDVIHYHGVGPSLVSWIPRLFTPHIKIITTFHSMDRKHQKWGWFARFMLKVGEYTACKFAHTLVAVSPTIEQYARDVYDTKATYIPNGVPLSNKKESLALPTIWNLKTKEYILMVSRLIPHKGVHYLIAAWKELKIEKPAFLDGKKLVIVGDGYYTENYVKSLKDQAKNEPSIVFTGFQNRAALNALYANALLQVHPSDNEGLPLCVLEGMSFGLPLLLSNIPEHRDLVLDSDALFQYGVVSDLKEKLAKMLSLSAIALENKGNENRRTIEKEYDWEKIIPNVAALYEENRILEMKERTASI